MIKMENDQEKGHLDHCRGIRDTEILWSKEEYGVRGGIEKLRLRGKAVAWNDRQWAYK